MKGLRGHVKDNGLYSKFVGMRAGERQDLIYI